MRRYFYTNAQSTRQLSIVKVWRLFKGGFPIFIGLSCTDIEPEEAAHRVISRVERLKLDKNFKLKNKNVEVRQL